MKVRFARHTDHLDELVTFYRDLVGLPLLGSFRDHDGYNGAFFDLPGTGTHLEFTSGGGHVAPPADPESLIVLYLESNAEINLVAGRLAAYEVLPANPYWKQYAVAFADPDGFQILLTLNK